MTIREILENTESRKIKLLQYAKDGNTVVTHHISAHPVVGNFYVYKTEPDEYGYSIIYVIAAFQCGYGVYVSTMPTWAIDMEKLPSKGEEFSPEGYFKTFFADYANEQAYLARMDKIMAENRYMRNLDIRMAGEILRGSPTFEEKLKEYTKYKYDHDTRAEKERQAKREQYEKEQAEKEKKAQQEHEENLRAFCKQLLDGGNRIEVNADLLFDVAVKVGVQIPIRTKGWIRKSLRTITVSDGKVSVYQYIGRPSTVFHEYANQILSALQQSQSVV